MAKSNKAKARKSNATMVKANKSKTKKALHATASTTMVTTENNTPKVVLPNEITSLILEKLRDDVILASRLYRAAFFLRSGPVLPKSCQVRMVLGPLWKHLGVYQNTILRFLQLPKEANKPTMNPQELHQLAKTHVGLLADKGLLGSEYRRLLEMAQKKQQNLPRHLQISLDDVNASMKKAASTEWKEVGELWETFEAVRNGKKFDQVEAMKSYMSVMERNAKESSEDVEKCATAYAEQLKAAYKQWEEEGDESDMPPPLQ